MSSPAGAFASSASEAPAAFPLGFLTPRARRVGGESPNKLQQNRYLKLVKVSVRGFGPPLMNPEASSGAEGTSPASPRPPLMVADVSVMVTVGFAAGSGC